jgi:hypothetical protein
LLAPPVEPPVLAVVDELDAPLPPALELALAAPP